jgi:sphingomyelin phosphodiesterase
MISEFEDIVIASFFGHTHHEHFELVFSSQKRSEKQNKLNIPILVSYITPSITPQTNINPSFKRFYYDKNTFQILNSETFTVDLTKANQEGKIEWKKQFSCLETYGMNDMSSTEWVGFVQRMYSNQTLFQIYWQNMFTQHPPSQNCIGDCKKAILCGTLSSTSNLYNICVNSPF